MVRSKKWLNTLFPCLEFDRPRLASISILGKEREPGVGKLGWQGNFDTGFEISLKILCAGFLHFLEIAIACSSRSRAPVVKIAKHDNSIADAD